MYRHAIACIALLAPTATTASEALIYAAIYECHADEINQDLARICSDTFPAMSSDAADALSKWRSRNSIRAQQEKDSCENELHEKERSARKSETETVRGKISNGMDEIRQGLFANLKSRGKDFCIEALHQLAVGSGAVDIK